MALLRFFHFFPPRNCPALKRNFTIPPRTLRKIRNPHEIWISELLCLHMYLNWKRKKKHKKAHLRCLLLPSQQTQTQTHTHIHTHMMFRARRAPLPVCCSVLQCVVVWCSVLQCVAECHNYFANVECCVWCVAVCCRVLQCGLVWCSVVQCGAVCYHELQCV